MLDEARRQAPTRRSSRATRSSSRSRTAPFERVFTGHFYGHLEAAERERFLGEARRVARELVVVDSAAARRTSSAEEWQERVLNDGSRWQVYKRYFEPEPLAAELGGGETVFAGRWFVAVRA